MCDCRQKKRDDKTVGKIAPETVTLFSKCPAPYRPGKDILEHTISIGSDRTPIDSVQSSCSDTTCESSLMNTLSIDTVFSSESGRTVGDRLEMFSMISNAIKLSLEIDSSQTK